MKKHFVTFYSPGTFVSETTTKPIDSWNVDAAVAMARKTKERHGATPYGFRFSTKGRTDDELDSHEIAHSGMYYLGGTVLTLKDVKDRRDSRDRVLISNMECNHYARVIENCNSWKVTLPLNDDDVVLAWEAPNAD